jgi:DNA mismatch endonuclease (patch repair protein)
MPRVEIYIRDGRAPIPESETRSRIMSAIKAKNTKPELLVRKLLSARDVRGYRLHPKKVPGRPDIAFGKKKIAIFVHGCFWHRCPVCAKRYPKTNRSYWLPKLRANVARDKRKESELRKAGWRVLVIWEHELKKGKLPLRVLNALKKD